MSFTIPYTAGVFALFMVMVVLLGCAQLGIDACFAELFDSNRSGHVDYSAEPNTSALQIGISIGSAVGGVMFTMTGSSADLAKFGAVFVLMCS
ncbi:hypothetical protein VQ056_29850 [Paenibacillus sp. JTLBN-2024]